MTRKKAILSKSKQTSAAALRNSTNNDARPRRPAGERLKSSVLEELWSIWQADPRVPSVKSRRSWAISRNASPRLVDNWFLRRKTCAKNMGQPIPDGSYDLPLDPLIVPQREQSATPVEPEPEASPYLPSDDTLVYPPDGDDMGDFEASSDTVYDEDTLLALKRTETPAFKEVPRQPRTKHHHFQPQPSSAAVYAAEDRCDADTSLENSSFPVCDQGRGKLSNFTSKVCSTKSIQDEVVSDSGAISDSDSRRNLTIPHQRLDFSPDTLSELSAIPFLFRTPLTVPLDNALSHPSVNNWTIIEEELECLVNERKLDFSFLDVPDLASMELHD
ncbi:hypothetical protein J3R82DRAFT_9751 [Butyriboletus roseoflavus]|nr:hypothetical protein J3R82DRAFT_9751 [Butyriboletus roseoflavus]